MQCVTAVDGYWLAELGPMFYTVKESTKTRLVSGIREVKDVKHHVYVKRQTRICITSLRFPLLVAYCSLFLHIN